MKIQLKNPYNNKKDKTINRQLVSQPNFLQLKTLRPSFSVFFNYIRRIPLTCQNDVKTRPSSIHIQLILPDKNKYLAPKKKKKNIYKEQNKTKRQEYLRSELAVNSDQ